ncbi:MAG: hypothetical protein C0617_11860 [Desulfuromonas sp.]|uniref:type II secretion system F family protein n=1 Tax=Desulfuromonas sp. TaxID=892 RepID=UPI000CC4B855|nr:type II secretion system F family protein [Desulfuromonas sp.]PLX83225.1 MAG: hypothetical protein C0617_11860 [Desulfuromonas sp.]
MAIELKTASAPAPGAKTLSWPAWAPARRAGISGRERMFFSERLALLLETGGALEPSLRALGRQTENPQLKTVIGALADEVLEGRSFSQALARHPDCFSSTYVNLVQASEQGGFLPRVLEELKGLEERRERLRSNLSTAFSYPAFLSVFSLAVIIFVLVVVFPKFGSLFETIRDELPLSTRVLMGASDLLCHYWIVILALTLALAVGLARWLGSVQGREVVDRVKLRLPLVRSIFIEVYLVQVLRVLSLSLASGVSVPDALRSCRDVVDNRSFRRFLGGLERHVAEGRGLAVGFEEADFIPAMAREIVRTGEETGNLATVMDRTALFYERDLEKKVVMVAKIVEPLMLLVMGVVVGLIVASLILPIFKLSRAVH